MFDLGNETTLVSKKQTTKMFWFSKVAQSIQLEFDGSLVNFDALVVKYLFSFFVTFLFPEIPMDCQKSDWARLLFIRFCLR